MLICSWVGTSAGMVEEFAQEGISAGMEKEDMARDKVQDTLEEDKAQGTLGEDKTLGTLWVGTQEEAGTADCTAAGSKTSYLSLRI